MITGMFVTGEFVNWGWEFPLEILVAMIIFVYGMRPRKRLALRIVLCLAAYAAFILFVPNAASIFGANAGDLAEGPDSQVLWLYFLFSMLWCIIIWALVMVMAYACFNESLRWTLFCGVAAYCVQHASYSVFCIMRGLFLGSLGLDALWMQYIIMAVCYVIMFFALKGNLKKDHTALANKKALLGLCVFAIFIVVGLSLGINFYARNEFEVLFRLYGMCAALLLLSLLFTMLSNDKYVRENYALKHMWQSDRKHYEAQKKDMELINIKIHDLKHGYAEENDKGMKTLLAYYDAVFKTGCEALDVVLTEKNFMCVKLGIVLTYKGDGSFFGFMADNDIYSLFCNILDNAIEAVQMVPKEMRQISITATRKGDYLSVTELNYFNGSIVEENGEIVTAKKDRTYHGFGIKSIKYVVDKYGGSVMVNTGGNVYCLNIVFFITDES